jgi:hypothetical protein
MSLTRALLEFFVTPPGDLPCAAADDFVSHDEGPERACAVPAPRTPPGVAVLASAADARPLGAALGLALAGARRAPAAVVCVWAPTTTAGPAWRAPALPAARRLAARLVARGHEACATGRVVLVRLPESPPDAAAQAGRVSAAAGAAPTVLPLGGPRATSFDALLAEQDLVVVATPAGTDRALRRLAIAGLATRASRTCACDVLPARPSRTLAAVGLTLLPRTRRAMEGVMEALS